VQFVLLDRVLFGVARPARSLADPGGR
jgi:hypothetical protein